MKETNFEKTISKKNFQLFIIILSLFLFLLAYAGTEIGSPEPSVFWYASQLHIAFWPGLIIAVFAILLSIRNKYTVLTVISILLPVLYLYTLPNMLHDMVPVFDVYHAIPTRISLIESGVWNMEAIPFPGSHIYHGFSIHLLGISGITYARIFPTILAFTIVLLIYTISKRISIKWAPVAPLTFLALNWYMEYHLARQPFGTMIWVAFWLAMFLYIDKKKYRLGILAAVILLVVVSSHPGMTIIVGLNLLALAFVTLISFRNKVKFDYLSPSLLLIIIFGLSFYLLFTFVPPVNERIMSRYEAVMEGSFTFSLGGPATTSLQYEFVNRLRMVAGFLHSFLGLVAFIIYYRYDSKRALFIGAWFFSCYGWFLQTFTYPHGMHIERAFLTAIIPASILTVALFKYVFPKNLNLRDLIHIFIIVILVAFLVIVPISKNSVDTIETPSRPSYQAGIFAEQNFKERVWMTDTHESMFRYIEFKCGPETTFSARGRHPADQPYGYRIPRTDRTDLSPMLFTDYFNNYIEIRYGNTTAVRDIERLEERYSEQSHRIYDSGGSRIYL